MIYSALHSYFLNISHFDLFRTSAHLCVFWNLLEVVPEHIFPPVRAAQAFIQCLQVHVLCLSDRCLVIFCFVLICKTLRVPSWLCIVSRWLMMILRSACDKDFLAFVGIIIITRPWPAYGRHGLAGSLGGDQSGRINSSHSIIEELARFARFARSDWTGLSDGDQSRRINSSHSMIHKFKRSDWMGLSSLWPK